MWQQKLEQKGGTACFGAKSAMTGLKSGGKDESGCESSPE